MFPAVPAPGGGQVRIPVEAKLKPGWHYDRSRRIFVSDTGETFKPADLPTKARIVPKVPQVTGTKLSKAEQDLQRYFQVILPPAESATDYVDAVRAWPCIDDASTGPEISLP